MGIPALAKAPDTGEAALHHSPWSAAAGVRPGDSHVRPALSTHRMVRNDKLLIFFFLLLNFRWFRSGNR